MNNVINKFMDSHPKLFKGICVTTGALGFAILIGGSFWFGCTGTLEYAKKYGLKATEKLLKI